ncbi:MAG: hypothetical protein GXO47_07225 [Chlorobi bacterium]|nr:hypothetical protein [Chlorobiota bacterium]
MKILSSSIFVLLLFFSLSSTAQDKVIKNSGDTLKCKVTEIGADEIKYYYPDNKNLILGIDKTLVDHIEFGTGEVIKIENNTFANPEYYAGQSRNALKIRFLSFLNSNMELTYERSLKPGRSLEASLGIIGIGFDIYDYNPSGVYGKFAYKFIRKPDYYYQRMHYAHILKGAYIAPELDLRYSSSDFYQYFYYGTYETESIDRENEFSFAVTIKFGKQWIIDDGFLVDLFLGLGYGMTTNDKYDPVNYGFFVGTSDFPIAFSAGLRLGWVFGKKKK